LQIKTKIVSSRTAEFKPVKQEVNVTVILPPLVYPGLLFGAFISEGLRTYFAEEKRTFSRSGIRFLFKFLISIIKRACVI
jgi:hypothetical protein